MSQSHVVIFPGGGEGTFESLDSARSLCLRYMIFSKPQITMLEILTPNGDILTVKFPDEYFYTKGVKDIIYCFTLEEARRAAFCTLNMLGNWIREYRIYNSNNEVVEILPGKNDFN